MEDDMTVIAAWLIYGLLAFALRTLVQLRTTGSSGWVSVRQLKQPLERAAWASIAIALITGFGSALLPPSAALELPARIAMLGWLLYGAGLVLSIASQFAMGRSWRIGQDAQERTEFVAHGPFQMVRNPIYSGMLLAVLGLTVLHCSWLACAAYGLLIVGLELQVRGVEEPFLARVHGTTYEHYAARVGRFFPGVGRFAKLEMTTRLSTPQSSR
jgi:protein-S-isoprenylcysteine O-methyltransferase Ste14